MRVLYVTPGCFDKGGISRYSRYQITALRRLFGERSIRAVSLLPPDANRIEQEFSVRWHPQSSRTVPSFMTRAQFATRVATEGLLWRPNVIHSAHVNLAPLVRLVARGVGARTVLNVYGLELWSGLSLNRKRAMSRMDHVISDCHATSGFVHDTGLWEGYPNTIWDPVDLEKFSPGPADYRVAEKYGIPSPEKHQIILSLGRLSKAAAHKGYDRLISAVGWLRDELPAVHVVLAGRGDDQPRLKQLADQHGLQGRVHFPGTIDEEDLAAVYRLAHVFSLVSDVGHGRGEGIPLTPLEAMSCGVPIVVGDEDGSREAIVDARNGFVISPRDPGAHVCVLRELLTNEPRRSEMGSEGRKVAEEFFSFEDFIVKHEQFFARLPV